MVRLVDHDRGNGARAAGWLVMADDTATAVARWRARMSLSQRAAAEALGMSLPAYQSHERGVSYSTGEPVRTSRMMLLACAAIEAGIQPIE